MADYTVTGLINSIKKRGIIPVSQKTFDTPDFIRIFDEELRLQVVPFIMQVRENYFVDFLDTAITANKANYSIPTRAIGDKLKNVYFIDSQNRLFELARIDIDDVPYIQNPDSTMTGIPRNFYMKDTEVVVVPTPDSTNTGSIRMYYYVRRNALVDVTAVGQITSINTGTGVLTLNNVPSTFTTSAAYDLIKATPGFKNYAIDQVATAVSGSSITFATLPSGLSIGDYVCMSQESPIPQITYELFPLLIQKALAVILRGINDIQGSAKAEQEILRLEESSRKLISDRVDESAKKIVSANNIGNWVFGRMTRW